MKKYLFLTTISLVLILSSCQKDNTTTTTDDPRSKFIGTWTCRETCIVNGQSSGAPQTFTITISNNPANSSQILISNFNLLGATTKAIAIVSDYNLVFPQQNISAFQIISGNGTMDAKGALINMSYSINDGAQIYNYTAVLTK